MLGRSLLIVALCALADVLTACPFCTAPGPTWAERRDAARVVLLGEALKPQGHTQPVRVHQVLKGAALVGQQHTVTIPGAAKFAPGTLLIAVDEPDAGGDEKPREAAPGTWPDAHTPVALLAVDENSASYYLKAPDLRRPATEQLNYYVRYLEASPAEIADDVYRQFGRASFNDVAQLADKLPMASLRSWLVDAAIPEDRRGFYGMALGLARDEVTRRENQTLLQRLIVMPANDYRAGFDGVLAGYLLLAGQAGLDELAARYVANSDARPGDVFHLLTAIRFYQEYGHDIPPAKLAAAIAPLVERPQFATAVMADLARWHAWDALPRVARWLETDQKVEPDVERAAVAYLLASNNDDAQTRLMRWRTRNPAHAAQVEPAARWLLGRETRD